MAIMTDSTRLKVLLKANNMKQREFAEWFCISQHMAWEITNGNRPLKDFEIVEICKRFNVSADWLLGLSDEKDELLDQPGLCDEWIAYAKKEEKQNA